MAVANPGLPNYGGAYESIANTIAQSGARRANMEANRGPSPAAAAGIALGNVAADVGTKLFKENQEKRLLKFKSAIEDDLAKNKAKYTAFSEGALPMTQQDIDDVAKQAGITDSSKVPQLGKDTIYMTPEVRQKWNDLWEAPKKEEEFKTSVENLASKYDRVDSKKAAFIRTLPALLNKKLPSGTIKEVGDIISPEAGKGNQRPQFLRDMERGITYQVTDQGLVPVLGAKTSGEKKSLDDLEKNDRAEFVRAATKFKTDIVKPKRESWDAANIAIKALEAKNPVLDVGVRVKLAKAFGDTGNISIVEQSQYGGSPELVKKVQNAVSKGLTGKISDDNRQYLLQAAKILKKGAEDALIPAIESEVSTAKDVYNIDPEFTKTYLTGSWGKEIMIPEFASEEAARAAGKKNGDKIKITGQGTGILE